MGYPSLEGDDDGECDVEVTVCSFVLPPAGCAGDLKGEAVSELEQLKARAAEVKEGLPMVSDGPTKRWMESYATDLDAAIAIAEAAHRAGDILLKESVLIADALTVAQSERDEAQAEVERLTSLRSTQASQRREQDVKAWAEEAKKARAAALRMHDLLGGQQFSHGVHDIEPTICWRCRVDEVLADTEWLEQHGD